MNLREIAENDLAITLEDNVNGFGWPVTIKNPGETITYNLNGQVHHIGLSIDPETGMSVSGESSHITIRRSSIAGVLPEKDWKVEFEDINGNSLTMYISEIMEDKSLGIITYSLRY
jgi:hypothetical protein